MSREPSRRRRRPDPAARPPTHLRSSDPTSAAHAGTVKLSSVSTAITPCPFGSSSTSADATETASSGTTAACAVSAVYPKVWYTETTPSEAAHAPTTKAPVPAYDFVSEKGHLTFPNLPIFKIFETAFFTTPPQKLYRL